MASHLVNPTGRAGLNDNKVDAISTKNNDMKMRRVVNAAAAINPNDYIIKSQLDTVNNTLGTQVNNLTKDHNILGKLISTLLEYGTHANRLAIVTGALADGSVFIETDRSNIEYQLQNSKWYYVAGEMYNTVASRPTDLGVGDTGFLFRASDTNQLYKWSGSAWVLEVWVGTVQIVAASTALTLTTATQTVPGTSISITQAGVYLMIGTFYFTFTGDTSFTLYGNMNPAQGYSATLAFSGTGVLSATTVQHWTMRFSTVPTTINLTAWKSGGSGASSANGIHTTFTALWVSP